MFNKGTIIQNKVIDNIKELEKQHNIELSNMQKIMLTSVGPITTILDVLYGEVRLFVLEQNAEGADKEVSELFEIAEGDEVYYRKLIVNKNGRPLCYAISYIPTDRCSEEVVADLHKEESPTSTIIYKHDIETILKITKISIEKPTALLKELFKTDEDMVTREYLLIHHGKIVTWTKEGYPITYFRE